MGSNHGPTRMALAEAQRAGPDPRREPRGRRQPRPAADPRPRHPARALRRGRRRRPAAVAGPAAAMGVRPRARARKRCARPARWSTCSATTRASPCGARTTSRSRSTCSRATPVRGRDVARPRPRCSFPSWNKDVLDRSDRPRALHKADPTRAVNPHSGVLPGLGSGGTDTHFYFGWYHGRMDGLAAALRAMPRLARFVTEFGAQAVPDYRGLHAPRALAGPRLGRPLRAPRAPEAVLRPARPARAVRVVRGMARRDPALPGRADPAADRGPAPAEARPHRRASASSASPTVIRRSPGPCSTTPASRRPGTTRCATPVARCCRCSSPAPARSTW